MKQGNVLFAAATGMFMAGFLVTSPALAGCDVSSEPFFMHKNDKTSHQIKTDGKGCDLNFSTDNKTIFRSATIVSKPTSGKLVKVALLDFAYHPKPGFKGRDAFSMRVCGSSPAGKGCSLLNYTADVD